MKRAWLVSVVIAVPVIVPVVATSLFACGNGPTAETSLDDGGVANLPPRTTPSSGDGAGSVPGSSGDPDAGGFGADGGPPSDSGPSVGSCVISGGVGVVLFGPQSTTRPDCSTQCAAHADHPNRACLWNATDITPRASCNITGGAGAQLFGPVDDTEAECTSECATLAATNPNRSCLWSGTDITPTDSCAIASGFDVGGPAPLFGPQATTEGQCTAQCTSFTATDPGCSCTWGATALK